MLKKYTEIRRNTQAIRRNTQAKTHQAKTPYGALSLFHSHFYTDVVRNEVYQINWVIVVMRRAMNRTTTNRSACYHTPQNYPIKIASKTRSYQEIARSRVKLAPTWVFPRLLL